MTQAYEMAVDALGLALTCREKKHQPHLPKKGRGIIPAFFTFVFPILFDIPHSRCSRHSLPAVVVGTDSVDVGPVHFRIKDIGSSIHGDLRPSVAARVSVAVMTTAGVDSR